MSARPASRTPAILFRVAGGPRIGFGHLARIGRLAQALGVRDAAVSVRGGRRARAVAATLGLRPLRDSLPVAVARRRPAALLIDDPNATTARAAVALARRQGVASMSLHDLGIARAGADLEIDGSAAPGHEAAARGASLAGLRYAILDRRCARSPRLRRRPVVVVTLGGGPRQRPALAIARAVASVTGVRVVVATGFGATHRNTLPPGVERLAAPGELGDALAHAVVAVTAGGLTLLEAAAYATPVIGVAVVEAQRASIEALARAGAALDGGRLSSSTPTTVAALVSHLLSNGRERTRIGRIGRRLVDGQGTRRVAAHIRRWLRERNGR